MQSEDVIRIFGRQLNPYERDEIADYDHIYYLNLEAKNKGVGQYVKDELTCQDENPKSDTPSTIFNHGFDND